MQDKDVHSTSSSSLGTTAILQQIKQSMAGPSSFGQSSAPPQVPVVMLPQNDCINDATSCFPTTPVKSGNPHANNPSGHNSSAKRCRMSPPSRKTTPTSTRKVRFESTIDVIQEMADLSKKRLSIAKQMLQRELDARPKVHSIEECMVRLYEIPNLSLEAILSACKTLKDEHNRSIFMTLSGDILYMWLDRQLVMQRMSTG